MFTTLADLRDFYQTPLGLRTQRVLRARLNGLEIGLRGAQVLTLGYGVPLLDPLRHEAAAVYAFMPATQGVMRWPDEGANSASLVDLAHLPLPDDSMDYVIALHALEGLAEPSPLLREVWRVMKAEGRLLLIVPNRRGLWAHSDRTPFGNGQPYSAAQIEKALNHQGFFVDRLRSALYAPPSGSKLGLSLADSIEKFAAQIFPSLGGVLLIEASKQLCAPLGTTERARQRRLLSLSLPEVSPLPT